MSFDLNLIEIAEPELLFGYGQSMEHPKDGLLLYGPKESPQAGSKLRIGVVSTAEGLRRYSKCVARMAIFHQDPDQPLPGAGSIAASIHPMLEAPNFGQVLRRSTRSRKSFPALKWGTCFAGTRT